MSGDSDKVLVTRARLAAGNGEDGPSVLLPWPQEPEVRRILRDCAKRIEELSTQLGELHELAAKHNPRLPSPEVAAEFLAKSEDTIARIGPEKAWENLMMGLTPQLHSAKDRAEVDDAWDRWDDEREPHAKAKLQMELGERVAGLMEDRDALIVARSQAPDRMKVEIAECIHCESLTLNPESDRCACGGELYPVVKIVPPGTRVGDAGMGDVVLPRT